MYFLLYRIPPLAVLWILFALLGRHAWFRKWGVTCVFLGGALAQLLWWRASSPGLENPDSLGFFRIGHGLETDLRSILYRPKLYPLFLGLFHSLKAATFFQAAIKLAMGGWLLRCARVLQWKTHTSAFVLALFLFDTLWLAEPLRIFDTALFAFLLLGATALALDSVAAFRPWKFAALCAVCGLTALTRQVADLSLLLVIAVASAAGIWSTVTSKQAASLKPRLLGMGLSIGLGFALAFSGALWNGNHYGVYRRSVALGVNAYTHTAYYRLADPQSREWDFVEHFLPRARREYPPWKTPYRYDMPWTVNALPHRLERKMGSANAEEIIGNDRILTRRFLDWAEGYPASYLASAGNEALRLLMKCEESYPGSLFAGPNAPSSFDAVPGKVIPGEAVPAASALVLRRMELGLVHQPLWLLFVAAFAALILERRRIRNLVLIALPLFAASIYLGLVAAIQIGLTRYALPAVPILFIAAGQACDRLPAFQARDSFNSALKSSPAPQPSER